MPLARVNLKTLKSGPANAGEFGARRTAQLLALAALCVAWPIHFLPHLHTANEAIRLYFVQALVDTGAFDLSPICALHGSIPVDRAEHAGRILMDKAPGLSLLLVPLYALLEVIWPAVRRQDFWFFGYLSCLLAVLLPLCAGMWQLGRWLRSAGVGERALSLTLLLLMLASPLFIYGGLLFGHGLAAGLIAAAYFGLGPASSAAPSLQRRLACGLCAGYAGVVDTPVFLLAGMVGLGVLGRWPGSLFERLRLALPFWAGIGAGAGLQLSYNAAVFGSPLLFAYGFKADAELAEIHAKGLLGFSLPNPEALLGLTFGGARGLFYHSPWLLMGLVGLLLRAWPRLAAAPPLETTAVADAETPRAAVRSPLADDALRLEARGLLLIMGGYFLFIASFVDWRAGDAAGPRHLLPLIPLLGAGVPFVLPPARFGRTPLQRTLLTAIASVACLAGVLMHLPTAAGFPYHIDRLEHPVFELAWPVVTVLASYAPSLGSVLGLPGAVAFAAQAGLVALCFALWGRGLRDDVATSGVGLEPSLRSGGGDLGRMRTLGIALALWLFWLAAMVAPLGKPLRAVQASRFLATSTLAPGLASRDRFADDPEGRAQRPVPKRPRVLSLAERKRNLDSRRAAQAAAKAKAARQAAPMGAPDAP